jgi:16S rRNA processing protein RimM
MQFELQSDFPERFEPGKTVYLGEDKLPIKVRGFRPHKNLFIISFDGFTTPEAIGIYRNTLVYIEAHGLPELSDGEFYHHQLLGLNIVTEDGRQLGFLSGILETGANDVFIIHTPTGPDLLLPVIDEVVLDIQPGEGKITVRLLPGLETE